MYETMLCIVYSDFPEKSTQGCANWVNSWNSRNFKGNHIIE